MATLALTPVQLISEVFAPESGGGKIIACLGSFGSPLRLAMEPMNAMLLGKQIMAAAEKEIARRASSSNVCEFKTARRA